MFGINGEDAAKLAQRYGQESYLSVNPWRDAELVFSDGRIERIGEWRGTGTTRR